jgi:spore maturation protein CgeB
MVDARAVWLVPGLAHPVFRRFADFFRQVFAGFTAFDYRAAYLEAGRTEDRILALVADADADIVIYTQFSSSFSYLSPRFLARLRPRRRVVGLGFDDEIYFEQAKYFYAQCDAVITTDIPDAEILRRSGIHVHLAQLQQPHVTPDSHAAAVEDIPVSFVGDLTKPGRLEFIQALEAQGMPVADYGKGSRHGPLSDDGVLDIFRRSRINLNFTRTNPPEWIVRSDPSRASAGQIKGRPFELAALGRFCLCEWAPCVGHWFRPDEEVGIFRSPAELVQATRRFLDDDALRRRVAAAAHERYQREYSPATQFSRIFGAILAAGPGASPQQPLAREPIYYESFGRSRATAFLHALRDGRVVRAVGQNLVGEARHAGYWRGFIGGVRDTLQTRLRRT